MEQGRFYEVVYGVSPKDFDVAFVSINYTGVLGNLNQYVLNELGYNHSILNKLDLEKGYDLYKPSIGIPIIFIVTVGILSTQELLKTNLRNAIVNNLNLLSNKRIWIPLMGTGTGKLQYSISEEIILDVIKNIFKEFKSLSCEFKISYPKEHNSINSYEKAIDIEIENNSKLENIPSEEVVQNLESKIVLNDEVLLMIKNTSHAFHLVGSNWGSEDQSDRFYKEGIWENGYGEEKFGDRVNKIQEGDILLNKSTYAKQDGSNYLRIKGIAIVTKNPKNSSLIFCNWIVKNLKIDIEDLSHYRDTISDPSDDGLITIISSLDEYSLKEILNHVSVDKKFSPFSVTPETNIANNNVEINEVKTIINTTTLAGLISDADTGKDYLEISKDVNAFALVMAAKSFEPPLAIALLGKWGSGKSFFMRKLKEGIQNLSDLNPANGFCTGIAHVHFNAWSYMDANLWASIVTRIFEGLNDYIKNSGATEIEIKEIEEKLFQKLTISKEELVELTGQKEKVQTQINELELRKKATELELKSKIDAIRKSTLKEIISKIDEEFKVQDQINKTLNDNPTFVETSVQFEKLVPKKYWNNPTEFYTQLKSGYTFIKAFFHRRKGMTNLFWVVAIIAVITFAPVFTYIINLLLSWQDFTLSNKQWVILSLYGGIITRVIDTFLKLKKQIAPFWAIKEDYESRKENALFTFDQEQKAIQLEIQKNRDEIIQLNTQIALNEELKATIEFKLKSALTTEALYTFIEKRANSDDYKKHLGIVSLIRKDFEILSGLLTGHQTELLKNEDSIEFKKLFKKPLERIILYIDDLDRCPEERVVEVLEAVNLLMAFPLFVVVVGVDPRWVKTALIKKHKNQFIEVNDNVDCLSPANYLEKIFQIPFHLKDASDQSIKNMIKTLANVKPNLPLEKTLSDYDENDYDTNDYDTNDTQTAESKETINLDDNSNIESVNPKLVNKEAIAALEITETESELLQSMSAILGNNPRAIKRFVNIYRIVKTHEDFGYNEEFDNLSEKKEDDLIIIMFLLAVSIGEFKLLSESIERYITETFPSIFNKFDYFKKDSSELDDKGKQLKNRLKNIIENNNINLNDQYIGNFHKHYTFIKRFTFKNI